MKKVLALVLTLAMLVGSLAIGLSAAFEYTATENGDVFENVYSIPLGSTVSKVTYLQIDKCSNANRNFALDLWFLTADGFVGTNYGSDIRPWITTTEIGLMVSGEKQVLPYSFELNTKYEIQIRTGGAESGKTNIIVNGTTIGAVSGQIPAGTALYTGADNVAMDNIKMSDGNDVQFERDFDGAENGSGSATGNLITALEVRRDLGQKYGSATAEGYTFAKVGEDYDWQNADGSFSIGFDISFINGGAGTQCELEPQGNGPWVTNTSIGVGVNQEGQKADYNFEYDQWYYVEYVSTADGTEIFVDGAKVEGTFPAMNSRADGQSIHKQGWYFWPEYIKMDNIKIGNTATIDFEADNWDDSFEGSAFTQLNYEGKKVDIWEKIQTYSVEGEATLIQAVFNEKKDPSKDDNALYITATYDKGLVNGTYLIDFDMAIYPDKEGTISEVATKNGSWIEFIVNKFGNGDDSRVKIGNNFVGKGKDLNVYGDEKSPLTKDMQPWAAGEFHNVAIYVANGSVTVYVDKQEVYSSPVGMDYFEDLQLIYMDNGSAIIDNYRIYDGASFEEKVNTFKANDGSDYIKTISDVKATDFCAANGHILKWERTTDPKCYDEGTNTYKCWNCDYTEAKKEVAKLEHKYQNYDIKRVNSEGLVYTACTRSEGCPERRYVQLPAAEDYTGKITYFHDFQDDFMWIQGKVLGFTHNAEKQTASYTDSDANYNELPLGREVGAEELNAGFKLGFDFTYNGTFDTSDTASRGHLFQISVGESVLGSAIVGYRADSQEFFIAPKGDSEILSDPYPLYVGETYHFEIHFKADVENFNSILELYINGAKVIEIEDTEAASFYLPYGKDVKIDCLLFHNFGIAMEMDNFVIGDNDFAWNRAYQGDADGDYAITGSDALLMRKYLASIVDLDELIISRADANMDGTIDARDQLRIRKILAGV